MIINPLPKIKEKKIPISKLGVNSRTFFYWKNENLLLEDLEQIETNQKVFFNLMDATWLMLIVEFRKYNMDLKTIKSIKDQLILEMDKNLIIENKAILQSVLLKLVPHLDEHSKQELLNIDTDAIINDYMSSYDKFLTFSKLGSAIGRVLMGFREYIMISIDELGAVETTVYSKGKYYDIKNETVLLSEFNRFINRKSCFIISLDLIIEGLLENEKLEKYNIEFGLYNQEELKILKAIGNDNWQKISFTKHDSGDITIINESKVERRGQQAREIKKLLGLKQYQKAEIVYRNDEHFVIHNTTKQIIKSPK
jgi:DNA-binding transcriptional MerR regulator